MTASSRHRPSRDLPLRALTIAAAAVLGAARGTGAQEPYPAPAPTPAAVSAPATKPWYEEIALNGFLSVSYSYNLDRPVSGTNQYRVFDFDDNSFKVDVFTLTLQKPVSKSGEIGFRVDADAGASIPRVSSSYGLFHGQDFDLKQAFVSYVVPVGSGLRIDAGKFLTHFNYEFIESWETPNDNATHSFMFGYAIPFTHTGVRSSYTFNDELAGMVMLANGWDNVKDNNSAKTVGAQLTWTPVKSVSVAGNFITGPERANVDGDPRTVFELVVQWKLSNLTVLGLDALFGAEKGAVVPGERATWSGLVGYARLGVSERFAICLRGEYFADPDGARTGVPQDLKEATLTPEWKISSHFLARADLRADWSSRDVFEKRGGFTGTQPSILLNVFYAF